MHFCTKHNLSHKAKCPECRKEAKAEFLKRHPTKESVIEDMKRRIEELENG